ncbi:sigma-70 family RNA polymerase sigma factor [Acanthopleuribacter pedis]|uniref:Sigma-70 family RNA polymerase sigma factor n=1 Tax=Acanthopleuribacter pedis TaxID=442870 RepID=A0A8J7QMU5_9BACT|nr:sigma-70 family RNA polymerase sigma factor [Acanthopleuribacter pedis]MBO1320905.1 sigma-70 family RNA polymerase sigma factor [Acanthopleuribacter pedis]
MVSHHQGENREAPRVEAWLQQWRAGSTEAFGQLFTFFYEDLKTIAHHKMLRERQGGMLQTTALVHSLYRKWAEGKPIKAETAGAFKGFASWAMTQILIDEGRKRQRRPQTESGDVPFQVIAATSNEALEMRLTAHQAMARLIETLPDHAYIAICYLLEDMTLQEIADAYQIPKSTVNRHWQLCKQLLARHVSGGRRRH